MKRFLAICAVVMCLAACMVPMAFADSVTYAACDVRLAGFEHGLSTMRPGASYSSGFYGGVVLFDGITCTSATVSDVVWVDDGSATGYFSVMYTVTIEPVSAAEMYDKPIIGIPLDWGSGNVRYQVQMSPDMNVRMEDATNEMRMHSLVSGGGQYYIDGTDQTMMTLYVSGYEEAETIENIMFSIKVWDTEATLIESAVYNDWGDWLTYPFTLVSAGDGVILAFFSTMMNVNAILPLVLIAGSTLVMSIISIVR